jgi:hypothetical protein
MKRILKKHETTPLECLLEAHLRIIHESTPGPWEVFSDSDSVWKDATVIGGGFFSREDKGFVLAARASWDLYWQVVGGVVRERAKLQRALAEPTFSPSPREKARIEQTITLLTDILKPLEGGCARGGQNTKVP